MVSPSATVRVTPRRMSRPPRLQERSRISRRAGTGVSIVQEGYTKSVDELAQKYVRQGYPSVDELIASQGVTFPRDPRDLIGNFWPEEESIDDFLAAVREWRGYVRTDPAA
jgi:hypothetical protein